MKTYYLHTIENTPAYFSKDDKQIVYANLDQSGVNQPLAKSLKQIEREQIITRKNRQAWGFAPDQPDHYGYVRVGVPR